jgi:hypothetical protein
MEYDPLTNAQATREIIRELRSDNGNNEAKGELAYSLFGPP